MSIKKADKKDIKEIVDVIRKSILATHIDIYPQDEIDHKLRIYSEDKIKEYMNKGEYFVDVEDNKIVGCVLVKEDNMRSLYVLPEYMKRGIGSKLAQKAEDCIKDDGYNHVNIWSSLISIDFYKSRGYKILGDIIDEKGRALHKEMRKELV